MLVAFDFDGTLADTYPIFRDAFDDAARKLGTTPYRRAEENYIRTLEAIDVLRFHDVGPDLMEQFIESLRQGMECRREKAQLFPNIREALNDLTQSGNNLALLSSNSLVLARASLDGLNDLFVSQRFDIPLQEKTAELRRMSCSSQAVSGFCYIGDEFRDQIAARSAEVTFAAVSWGYNTPWLSRESSSCRLLHDPRDIAPYIRGLRGPG